MEWISAHDETPELDQRVLILYNDGTMQIAYIKPFENVANEPPPAFNYYWTDDDQYDDDSIEEPDYWMPLPPPPVEQGKEVE